MVALDAAAVADCAASLAFVLAVDADPDAAVAFWPASVALPAAVVTDCDAAEALPAAFVSDAEAACCACTAAAADPAADFSLVTSSTRIDRRSMSMSGRMASAVKTPMRNCVIDGSGSAGIVFSTLTASQSPVPARGRLLALSPQLEVKSGNKPLTIGLIHTPGCAARAVTVIRYVLPSIQGKAACDRKWALPISLAGTVT